MIAATQNINIIFRLYTGLLCCLSMTVRVTFLVLHGATKLYGSLNHLSCLSNHRQCGCSNYNTRRKLLWLLQNTYNFKFSRYCIKSCCYIPIRVLLIAAVLMIHNLQLVHPQCIVASTERILLSLCCLQDKYYG